MQTLDLVVIALYLVGSVAIGLVLSGKQRDTKDYFVGGRQMPWWAVMLSIVATETSALTVISVPGYVWGTNLTFLQLALGYIIGRILVAAFLLPRYYRGELTTAYGYLGKRFGDTIQGVAGVTFIFTRLLADGVRLFAAAIPCKVILKSYGVDVSLFTIIAVLGVVTVLYTLIGGLRAVVWVDVFQMAVYLIGGLAAFGIVLDKLDENFWTYAQNSLDDNGNAKTQFFSFDVVRSEGGNFFADLFNGNNTYFFLAAIVGGALLTMASHGVDQIIVQRLLGTPSQKDAKKALIGSGIVVLIQFAVFLLVGLALWAYYKGADPTKIAKDPAATSDSIFPQAIIDVLPTGVSGLMLAAILAAAMSTLSSSLNAMASSSMADIYEKFTHRSIPDDKKLVLARVFTFVWGGVFILAAAFYTGSTNPVIELGLSVASVTYGGLLGAFFLGMWVKRARQLDCIVGFVLAVGTTATMYIVQAAESDPDAKKLMVAFTWYTAIGVVITLVVGGLLSLRHKTAAPAGEPEEPEPARVP